MRAVGRETTDACVQTKTQGVTIEGLNQWKRFSDDLFQRGL